MVTSLLAAKAYAQVQAQVSGTVNSLADKAKLSDSAAVGADFGKLLTGAMNDITASGHQAEAQITAHTKGKANLVDVVTAVASAQSSLETALAVRDQVIAAYQEIMHMSI